MLSRIEVLRRAGSCPIYSGWNTVPESIDRYPELWASLPLISRDELRRCADCSEARCQGQGEMVFFTSGTTDQPKIVRMTPDDLARIGSLCARFSRFEGITGGARVMVLLPMGLWTVGKVTALGHVKAGAEVFPVDLHGGVDMWKRMAEAIQPTVISSTPSVLAAFARHYAGPALNLVETTGEPLLHRERMFIEDAFDAPVYDAYGLSECVVGVECKCHDGYHFWPDAVRIDVVDPETGQPLPDGQSGEIVTTSLMQAHMPIVRYRTGDRGYLSMSLCRCGSTLPVVVLEGRLDECLALPRGVQLTRDDIAAALIAAGARTFRIRLKGAAGLSCQPHLPDSFIPAVEIDISDRPSPTFAHIGRSLLASLPTLAELVHEGDLFVAVRRASTRER